jgi:NIPSNAP
MKRVVEIRSYQLKAGQREEFLTLFRSEARPLLERWNVDVVAFGASLGDDQGAYLMRAFDSLEARQREEAAFYGSAEWRDGPRAAILECIDSYLNTVLEIEERAINAMRTSLG